MTIARRSALRLVLRATLFALALAACAGVLARLNRELVAILQQPEFMAQLRECGFEALPGTPEYMSAAARKERESWKKVVEISGAKAE